MIRALVERLTRRLILRRRLQVGDAVATIYVSPSAGLRYLFKPMGRIDPNLIALAEEFVQPGDVVWDIGANVGLFSVAASLRAGPTGVVVSVEPDAWLVQLLRRTGRVSNPGRAPINIVPAAVGGELSIREFYLARRSRSANYLGGYGTTQTGGSLERQHVVAVTLDWLAQSFPPPRVLKIDVEGAEREVLAGGSNVLATARPIVICEVASESSASVSALLNAHNYTLLDGQQPTHRRRAQASAPWMTVALPATCSSRR